MDPKDDPEARIRELEQASGADRAVELGVGDSGPSYSYVPPAQSDSFAPPPAPSSYPPPPPAPPSGYPPPSGYAPPSGYPPPSQPWSATPPPTGPFSGAPRYVRPSGTVRRSGSRRLVLIPIAIALFAFGPGVVSLVTSLFHTSGVSHKSGSPSFPSGGGGFTFAPTTAPTVPLAPTTPPPGSSVTIAGNGETKTIACNDSTVIISGYSNAYTISGHCSSLTVSGKDNAVVVEAADTIDAGGIDNKVTYHSGTPNVEYSGIGNVVQQG